MPTSEGPDSWDENGPNKDIGPYRLMNANSILASISEGKRTSENRPKFYVNWVVGSILRWFSSLHTHTHKL